MNATVCLARSMFRGPQPRTVPGRCGCVLHMAVDHGVLLTSPAQPMRASL